MPRGGYTRFVIEREQPPTDAGAGYPEDGQPGTGMDPKEHAENDVPAKKPPEAGEDGDPGQATGIPGCRRRTIRADHRPRRGRGAAAEAPAEPLPSTRRSESCQRS